MKLLDPKLHAAYWNAALPKPTPGKEPGKKPELYFVMGVDGKGGRFRCFERIFEQRIEEAGGPGLHRRTFLDLLVSLVSKGEVDTRGQGPYVSFGKKLIDVKELGSDSGVELEFEDGSKVHADAVVGCDGIRGLMRKLVLERNGEAENVEPRFSGKFCYRGLIPLSDEKAREGISEEIRGNMIFQFTYGAHLYAYPIRNGEILNVIATHKTDDGKWPHEKWVVPAEKNKLEADMKLWGPPARAVLSNMKDADVWALFESRKCRSFYRRGKMCIMGDCAHATTPHQGAGASQCIEDALMLSRLFGMVEKGNEQEIERVFEAYDAVRRPRSQKVIKTSTEMSDIASLEGAGTGDDVDTIRESLKNRFRWLWHADLEKVVEEAKDIYLRS